MTVRLSDGADALGAGAGRRYLYDPETDRILSAKGLKPAETAKFLPIECDTDEVDLMEAFLEALPEDQLPDEFAWGGASDEAPKERFERAVFGTELEQRWYDYRDQTYLEIARGWCREHGVHFTE